MLVFKDFSWQTYSEKKLVYQIVSMIIVIIRAPLLILAALYILHNLVTFQEVENTYLKYVSVICALINSTILVIYSYLGSYLFNLTIPNEQLPWADTSHQPYLLQTMFKLLLVFTFKLRDSSFALIYSLAAVTMVICGYRLYLLLLKSHMFDDTVYRVSIMFDFGIIHLLAFFLLTAINQGQDYYLLFVVGFLPITCMSGFFVKERCKRIWLSQLMNDTMETEGEQLLCFLYLIFLYTQENDDSWQQLIRLQQLHYTRCEQFFNSIEKKMIANLKVVRGKQRFKQQQQDALDNEEFAEAEALLKHEDTLGDKSSHHHRAMVVRDTTMVHAESHGQLNQKSLRKSINEHDAASGRRGTVFTAVNGGVSADDVELELDELHLPDTKQAIADIIGENGLKIDNKQVSRVTPRTADLPNNSRRSTKFPNQLSGKHFESGYLKGKQGKSSKTVASSNMSDLFGNLEEGTFDNGSRKHGFQAKAFDLELKKELLRKLVRHYFNSHLLDDQQMGFQLKLVKIFFTYKILKNHYLAHFLLFSYQEDEDSDNNFIIANQRLLNQRYVDELISIRQLQEVENNKTILGQVDLLGLLKVNQLLVEFDNQLERISSEILDFWENLVNSRETVQIFTQGIKISDYLKEVQALLAEIQEKQSDSESKIYLQMAQFYGQVVFKSFESMQMLDRARIAIQVQKLSKMTQERSGGEGGGSGNSNENQEKCLLMAHISLKKPMKITFINKAALKLLQYSMNEALQLSINNIMPKAISEMHAQFLDQFMLSGKTRMLKTKMELFIKQRCGNVVPVFTYLFVNNMSRKHMIFMFEPNTQYKVFDDPQHNNYYSFLLSSDTFKLGELSESFDRVTGVTNSLLAHKQEELDRQVQCDDLIRIHSQDQDIQQLEDFSHEGTEVEISFKVENQRFQLTVDSYNDEYNQEYQMLLAMKAQMQAANNNTSTGEEVQLANMTELVVEGMTAEQQKKHQTEKFEKSTSFVYNPNQILTPVFIMKVITLPFIDGKFELKLLAFRRKYNCYITGTGEYFQPPSLKGLSSKDNMLSGGMYGLSNDQMQNGAQNSQSEGQLLGALASNDDSLDDHHQYYDVQSHSSTGSFSSQSTTVSVFSTYTQQVNSNVTPKTLKFILNMVLLIILVMIIASSLILSISLGNLSRAEISIEVNKHSFEAIDGMTTIRLLLRSLANIYQGYQLKKGEYMSDRATHYEGMILDINEQMRDDANFVASVSDGSLESISKNIQCGFLSAAGTEFIMNQSLSQGVNLLVSKVQDVIKSADKDLILGKSLLPFLNFGGLTVGGNKTAAYIKSSTLQGERDAYFVLNNTNGDLHYKLKSFGTIFSQIKLDEISSNVNYLSGMSLGVISVILLSGFLVIPLFGKIQNRILELMKLFFAIDIKIKKSTIERIEAFQRMYFKGAKDEKYRAASVSSFDELDSQVPNGEQADVKQIKVGKKALKKNKQPKTSLALPSKSIATPIKKVTNNGKVVQMNGGGSDQKLKTNKKKEKPSSTNQSMQNENKRRPAAFRKVAAAFGLGKGRRASQVQKHDDEDSSDSSYVEHKKKKKHVASDHQMVKNEKKHNEEDKEEDENMNKTSKGDKKSKKKSEYRRNSLVSPRGKKGGKNEDPTESYGDESGSHGDSKDDEGEDNFESAKAKKKRDDDYKQAQIDVIINKEKEVIEEFSKYTNKRKLFQAFFIIMMLSIMASYFLIKYLLSLYMFDKMKSSVVDLEIIFGRLACSQNVLNTYVESYFSTDLLQNSNLDFLSLNRRIDSCMETERQYQRHIVARPESYLRDSIEYITAIEAGLLCEGFANISMSYDQCISISEQIRKQGLATYYFDIMKSVKQMELDLMVAVKAQGGLNKTFVAEQINSKIATYVDTLILIVLPAQGTIQTKSLKSIYDYYGEQGTILSIIFSAYFVVTILMAVVFIFSMYVKLRKEMLASNRLLYIIDFESLAEAERQIILKFLLNY